MQVRKEGQLYYIVEVEEFQYCDGSAYQTIDLTGPQGISITWLGGSATAPVSCDGDHINNAYYNTSDGISYICDSTGSWDTLAKDGQNSSSPTVSGIVEPGEYLTFNHNLGRDDIFFRGNMSRMESCMTWIIITGIMMNM